MIIQYKKNLYSINICLIYSVIIFGPHRLFGFNFIQEILVLFLGIFHIFENRISKRVITSIILLSSFLLIKLIQSIILDYQDYTLLSPLLKLLITFLSIDFILFDKKVDKKNLLYFLAFFNLLNALSIVLQFIFPDFQSLFYSGNIEKIFRYRGLAWDGYQITTLISSIITSLLFCDVINNLKKNLINNLLYAIFVFCYVSIILSSWIFQGRASLIIGILIFGTTFFVKLFKFKDSKIYINKATLKFYLPFFLTFVPILKLSFNIYSDLISSILDTKQVSYGFEIFQKNWLSIRSFVDYFEKKSLFFYFSDFNQWLIGSGSSGRGDVENFQNRVIFDNGYYLDIFAYGIIGTSLIYLLSIYILKGQNLRKKTFLIFLSLLLLFHLKESVYLSGSSFVALALFLKMDDFK